MKKVFLLLPLIAGIAFVTLCSNSNGSTTGNRSGSDTATAGARVGCGGSGCHGSAASSSDTMLITVDSAASNHYVTKYKAGKTYKIKIVAVNASLTAVLPKFGFQMTVVSAGASDYVQAGTFSSIPAMSAATPTGTGINVWSHTSPWTSGGTGGAGSIDSCSIMWTAPATAGTGPIKIFAAVNQVDGDGAAGTGDKWNTKNITLTEINTTGVENVGHQVTISAFPNPVTSTLSISLQNTENGTYNVNLFNLNGQLVAGKVVSVSGASTTTSLDMSSFPAGMYQLVVEKDGVVTTTAVSRN